MPPLFPPCQYNNKELSGFAREPNNEEKQCNQPVATPSIPKFPEVKCSVSDTPSHTPNTLALARHSPCSGFVWAGSPLLTQLPILAGFATACRITSALAEGPELVPYMKMAKMCPTFETNSLGFCDGASYGVKQGPTFLARLQLARQTVSKIKGTAKKAWQAMH